jgi:hypothetical protein
MTLSDLSTLEVRLIVDSVSVASALAAVLSSLMSPRRSTGDRLRNCDDGYNDAVLLGLLSLTYREQRDRDDSCDSKPDDERCGEIQPRLCWTLNPCVTEHAPFPRLETSVEPVERLHHSAFAHLMRLVPDAGDAFDLSRLAHGALFTQFFERSAVDVEST